MRQKPSQIIQNKCSHLILCEGADAFNFLIHFLKYTINNTNTEFDNFCIYDFGGISQLTTALKAVVADPDFKIIKSICVIRDSESNAESAIQSIKNSLHITGFAAPENAGKSIYDKETKYPNIKTGFILFPSCSENVENGTLEDLCLRIIDDNKISSVREYADSILNPLKDEGKFVRPHKNTLHTYLSLTNDFVGLKIGEAAKAHAFLWSSPHMLPLKNFLESMLDTTGVNS